MTTTRLLSWRELIIRAEPDFVRESRFVIEYEFTAPQNRAGDPRTHEGQMRVFRGNYDVRGPYTPEPVPDGGLIWGGQPLIWNGEQMTWGEE